MFYTYVEWGGVRLIPPLFYVIEIMARLLGT